MCFDFTLLESELTFKELMVRSTVEAEGGPHGVASGGPRIRYSARHCMVRA